MDTRNTHALASKSKRPTRPRRLASTQTHECHTVRDIKKTLGARDSRRAAAVALTETAMFRCRIEGRRGGVQRAPSKARRGLATALCCMALVCLSGVAI